MQESLFSQTHHRSHSGHETKGHRRMNSLVRDSRFHKLTMGLKTYQDIKQAHLGSSKHALSDLSKAKEHQECTFEPKINESTRVKRSLQGFLKDQEKFVKEKELKITNLRREINKTEEEELTGRPTIDKFSQRLSQQMNSSVRSTNIFKRLSKERPQKTANSCLQEQLFTPKILNKSKEIVRKQNISTLLYEDARRRQEKEYFKQNEFLKKRDASPKINANTNALVGRKICSEFMQLVSESQISPLVALSVLSEIFNVDLNPNRNQTMKGQCEKILSYLIQNKSSTIKTERIWNFIQIIINGHLENSSFTPKEEQQILSHYQYFYHERLTKERKPVEVEQYNFRPSTLASSQRMADHHREKTCEAVNDFIETQKVNIVLKDGAMKIEDLFIIDHLKRKASNEKKRIENENKELALCSFRPDISSSKTTLENLKKKKKIVLTAASNRETIKAQDQKMEENLAFKKCSVDRCKPLKDKSNLKMVASTKQIKDIQKIVLRMSVGRQNRQYSNRVFERGYRKDENWVQYKKQKHKSIIEVNQNLKGYSQTIRS